MPAVQDAPRISPELSSLLKACLGKEVLPVTQLPGNLRGNDRLAPVLAAALSQGLVELGRREHSQTIVESKVRKGPDGKILYDDQFRQVVDHVKKWHLDNGWSWLSQSSRGRKSVALILEEDRKLPVIAPDEIRLHVRLTSEGESQAA